MIQTKFLIRKLIIQVIIAKPDLSIKTPKMISKSKPKIDIS